MREDVCLIFAKIFFEDLKIKYVEVSYIHDYQKSMLINPFFYSSARIFQRVPLKKCTNFKN